ncbi:acyl--CoA ligase [Geomonas sp. Red32]|uniref:class I adenylate-forming enzyme family protein n=1 Tax=Geomonas sp. Red32 TaxID=2912856 RepID=UPI00202CB543|nr:class I adenylate-forming enzyme family protein [Geomonas sp. Red32]MCM0082101.1 acyl--CoA ligase [Geomonas sp. Red32]
MDLSHVQAVHKFLEMSAVSYPDRIAFIQDEERVSYARINEMANQLALWLLDQGIKGGDRIVILLENSLEYVVSYYGILKAGAVAVPLNVDARAESLAEVLTELKPAALVSGAKSEQLLHDLGTAEFKIPLMLVKSPTRPWESTGVRVSSWDEMIRRGRPENPSLAVAPHHLASIIYTSGSTGKPKGVMLTHQNIVANTSSIVQYLHLTQKDIQMVVLPFFYVMGKSLLNTHFAVGGTVVVNNNFAYPASVIRQMAEEKVTGFSGVPATYAYLLHRSPLLAFRERLSSLRYCTQAGGHMSRQIKEQLLEALPPHTKLYVMYGATEAAARLTYVEPELLPHKIESIGRAIPGVTIRVLDENGREVAAGELGELVASGPNIMLGYWKDAAATGRALDHHGYHTGDLGYQDNDGFLYVVGRKDDLVKSGGHRIDPQEIEDVLMATGLLLEVAVMGVDDPLLGKKLVAVAAPLNRETTANQVLAFCLGKLPRHKLPAEIRMVEALPKYASSKIDRARCLALLGGAEGSRETAGNRG